MVRLVFGLERQRQGIDAITQAGGWRAVGKDMPKVRIADVAKDFGSDHAMAGIGFFTNIVGIERFEITGPSASSIKFCVGREQRRATADALVDTGLCGVPVLTSEWAFGSLFAYDRILLRGKLGAPFGFGFTDFFHGITCKSMMSEHISVILDDFGRSCHERQPDQ